MSAPQEEWKLNMLHALTRSQLALARIIECVADSIEASPPLARHIAENLDSIIQYNRTLDRKLSALTAGNKKLGPPGKIWLHPHLKHQRCSRRI